MIEVSLEPVGAASRVVIDLATSAATAWLTLAVLLTVLPVMWSLRLMRA